MKHASPLHGRKARIEIIPLIDIMFFLLASFMLVTLNQVKMRGMKINMPTASAKSSPTENKQDFTSITIDATGQIYVEKDKVSPDELLVRLQNLYANNALTRVYIRGDKDATHGEIITVLDKVKTAGITKVAFEIKLSTLPGGPSAPGAPPAAAPAPPSAPKPPTP